MRINRRLLITVCTLTACMLTGTAITIATLNKQNSPSLDPTISKASKIFTVLIPTPTSEYKISTDPADIAFVHATALQIALYGPSHIRMVVSQQPMPANFSLERLATTRKESQTKHGKLYITHNETATDALLITKYDTIVTITCNSVDDTQLTNLIEDLDKAPYPAKR